MKSLYNLGKTSEYKFPTESFFQMRPKLQKSMKRFLRKGMVRTNHEFYDTNIEGIFRRAFKLHHTTWTYHIEGTIDFYPTRIFNLDDDLKYEVFIEGVADYVNDVLVTYEGDGKWETYVDMIKDLNLDYIPVEVLDLTLKNLGMKLPSALTFDYENIF